MSNLGAFIWSIADVLRGPYKPHQYGDVILPMTILRRLDCMLADCHDEILKLASTTSNPDLLTVKVRNQLGLDFCLGI
ncbi:Type I restriction-modification system methyltransferase subunit [Chlamydia trachomatis]|nr:Type I restriction-modification system methyltransferase subunit [Chlamydia trachomatis]